MSFEDIEARWASFTPFQKLAAVYQFIEAGAFDAAEGLLEKSQFSSPEDKATAEFFTGLIRRGQGRPDEAIGIFRGILADNPNYTKVRLALAETLYQQENDESAKHHLELLLADVATDPNLSNSVRGYISAIDSRRRWSASTYLSIAPSTNFNQGSDNSIVYLTNPDGTQIPFELSDGNLKKSGVGVSAGGQLSYRHPLSEELDIIASGSIHSKTYGEKSFNDALFAASIGPRIRTPWGYVGLYGLIEERLYANDPFSFSYGALFSTAYRFGPADALYSDVTCMERNFESDWQGVDMSYQNGHACNVASRFEHAFDSATLFRALTSFGRERTGREHLNNDSWSLGAGIYRELPFGVTAYVQAEYTNRDFEGLYPGASVSREDGRWDFSVNLTKRDWSIWGYAPMLQYTYTTNGSNVGFHDYDAHTVNLTWTAKH